MESPRTVSRLLTPAALARGFTVIEMLVVLAIIIVITMVALLSQDSFNRSIILTDTAYSVALSVREMQTLGLSSRKTATGLQNAGYGTYFYAGNTYITFSDIGGGSVYAYCSTATPGTPEAKPGNCRYDAGTDTLIKTYRFDRGFTIRRVCGSDTSGTRHCTDGGTGLSAVHVVFTRPNTESIITGIRSSVAYEFTSAEVYLETPDGSATRSVCISKVGQVSVAAGTCQL